MNELPHLLQDGEIVQEATGFLFTEGPSWHPDGFLYFADVRGNSLHKWTPGKGVEFVRETAAGNGTTFDLKGRLVQCEGPTRGLTRMSTDGKVEMLASRFKGGRFNAPNDVICRSDGTLFFTDPSYRMPFAEREIPAVDEPSGSFEGAAVYKISPEDDSVHHVAFCEYPNGLAFSPDERYLYVANTRSSQYIHRLELDANDKVVSRSIFADLNGKEVGVPDGLKVDQKGQVFCTGPGGIWVTSAEGEHLGIIRVPERPANFAFIGDDLRTLVICAFTSIYSLRVLTPGLPQPFNRLRAASAA